MTAGYQNVGSNEGDQVQDALETLVTEGARRMLESALEEEVSAFLGRAGIRRAAIFGVTATAFIVLARSRSDSTLSR